MPVSRPRHARAGNCRGPRVALVRSNAMGRLSVAAGVLTAACSFAVAAFAAPSAVSLTVAPANVHRGHRVIIRGNAGDCPLGDAVTIISRAFAHTHDFAGLPAVFARVRTGGRFGIRPRIPSNRQPGNYVVTARCGGGNLGVSAQIHVLP